MGALRLPTKGREGVRKAQNTLLAITIDKKPKSPPESKGFLDKLTAGFMMAYTLGQAAASCGRSKPTLLSAIKSGRLSANRNERREWQIDPAELARVYPPKKEAVKAEQPLTAEESAKIKFLEDKIKLLEETVAGLREDKTAANTRELNLRLDVEQWQGVVGHLSKENAQLKQLAAPSQEGGEIIDAEPEPAQRAAGGQRGGFWSYFFPWL